MNVPHAGFVEYTHLKKTRVTVPWKEGLHLRNAARVVKRARIFQSSIRIKVNERVSDARSVLGLLLLCATLGTVVDLEAAGEDEDAALASVSSLFEEGEPDSSTVSDTFLHTGEF